MPRSEPTWHAAQARLAAVDPAAYARTRNSLDGAVTRLSPYLTHGFLSLPEVYSAVHSRHALDPKHKLVFELGWRAYWRHVWAHLGDGIHHSRHPGLLPDDAYVAELPADVQEACTGIPAIDLAVRELYETGYLHNHARMWLASYLVHLRKVHWHAGAQWMLGHLLDGDVASNHLSWQWVAGTGSSKPYLFSADNVAKYAPAQWHSPGTVIDTSYEAMDRMARRNTPVVFKDDARPAGAELQPPSLHATPPDPAWTPPENAVAAGRDIWLIHPWSLGPGPPTTGTQVQVIGVGLPPCHAHTPWSQLRWRFVTEGMQTQTSHLWWGSVQHIACALQGARSVRWQADPHVNAALCAVKSLLDATSTVPTNKPFTAPQQQPCLFEPVVKPCNSFSEWWRCTRLRV
jgi:deoxyribodipyrimidine photo-lyase